MSTIKIKTKIGKRTYSVSIEDDFSVSLEAMQSNPLSGNHMKTAHRVAALVKVINTEIPWSECVGGSRMARSIRANAAHGFLEYAKTSNDIVCVSAAGLAFLEKHVRNVETGGIK